MPGYAIVTLSLKPEGGTPGDATAEQMDAIADLADRYSFGEIRVGHEQNLVLPHVRQRDLPDLWRALDAIGVATPNVEPDLRHHRLPRPRLLQPRQCALDSGGAGADAPVSAILDAARNLGRLHINISGCINACGHHHVGHIGLLGVEKNGEEYYQVTIGGRADEKAELGTLIGPAVPYGQVADVVEDIAAAYLELRERPDELFIDAVKRLGVEPFRERVYAARQSRVGSSRIASSAGGRRADPGRQRPSSCRMTRLLADPGAVAARPAPTGVIWPNDRKVSELAPFVDRLALIALVFPVFKDGRAYSQARILREQYGFDGELRATGQVLRDQFLFMLRAGFDAFEVTKDADAAAFRRDDPALQRVLPADRRRPADGPPARLHGAPAAAPRVRETACRTR